MQLRIAAIRRLILVAPQVTDTYNITATQSKARHCGQGPTLLCKLMSTFRNNDFFTTLYDFYQLCSIVIAHFAQTIGIAAVEVINKS